MLRQQVLRVMRGLRYASRYAFVEYPRGLDFSIRDKSTTTIAGSHGYALTSKPALANIVSHIAVEGRDFLDIGSGKGGVICFAHELGFRACEGIEYEPHLHDIATRNVAILGYGDSVRSVRMDARQFPRYADFDVYFLFNPFDYDTYAEVLAAIVAQNRENPSLRGDKHLICYGDANLAAVEAAACFTLVAAERCPYRGNEFHIYKLDHA